MALEVIQQLATSAAGISASNTHAYSEVSNGYLIRATRSSISPSGTLTISILDIRDPSNLQEAGSVVLTDYFSAPYLGRELTHDPRILVDEGGDYVYVTLASNENIGPSYIVTVDISDKNNPVVSATNILFNESVTTTSGSLYRSLGATYVTFYDRLYTTQSVRLDDIGNTFITAGLAPAAYNGTWTVAQYYSIGGQWLVDCLNPGLPACSDTTGTITAVAFNVPYRRFLKGNKIVFEVFSKSSPNTWVDRVVDISNPNLPVYTGNTATLIPVGGADWWVSGDKLYDGTSTTVRVYDVSTPSNPTLLNTWTTASVVKSYWAENDTYLYTGAYDNLKVIDKSTGTTVTTYSGVSYDFSKMYVYGDYMVVLSGLKLVIIYYISGATLTKITELYPSGRSFSGFIGLLVSKYGYHIDTTTNYIIFMAQDDDDADPNLVYAWSVAGADAEHATPPSTWIPKINII